MKTEHPKRPAPAVKEGELLLSLKDVAVAYGGIRAIKGISLDVKKGEIVSMIGANGAGKTTTLKSIMRLLPLVSGTIEFAGQRLVEHNTEEVVDLGISLVPEGRAIFPNLSVKENLDLGAYNHKDPKSIKDSLEDVVKLFPRLGERMKQEGGTLSGGEQQMLAIGRAMMAAPSLLLLDEPSLGLAPLLVDRIYETIAEINRQGMTILLVEQSATHALGVSNRGYVLETGEVALTDESSALQTNPDVQKAYLGL